MGSVEVCRTFWIKAMSSSALFFNKLKLPWRFEMKLSYYFCTACVCECTKAPGGWDVLTWTLVYVQWFSLQQCIICALLCLGKHLCHMSKVLLDLLTKRFLLPPSSQPSVPPASISFRCYWQHHFNWVVLEKAMREGGRWWHSLSRVIGLSIPMFSRQCFSFLQQVAKLCSKKLDVHFPVDSLWFGSKQCSPRRGWFHHVQALRGHQGNGGPAVHSSLACSALPLCFSCCC